MCIRDSLKNSNNSEGKTIKSKDKSFVDKYTPEDEIKDDATALKTGEQSIIDVSSPDLEETEATKITPEDSSVITHHAHDLGMIDIESNEFDEGMLLREGELPTLTKIYDKETIHTEATDKSSGAKNTLPKGLEEQLKDEPLEEPLGDISTTGNIAERIVEKEEQELTSKETEAKEEGAYNPDTGEINWDCPCLGGMAHGPCGEEFKIAFACFVYSEKEPKGVDCIEKFQFMQDCFKKYPEQYSEQLDSNNNSNADDGDNLDVAQGSPEVTPINNE